MKNQEKKVGGGIGFPYRPFQYAFGTFPYDSMRTRIRRKWDLHRCLFYGTCWAFAYPLGFLVEG